jgi:ubiquinone/menaquinone biosynthesis C-methylase UbiE
MTDATKQEIGRYWAKQAATFDSQGDHAAGTEAEHRAWQRVLDLLTPTAPTVRTLDVLDVGCGTGFLALLFAERGHRVTGIDLATEMIEQARAKAARFGGRVAFHAGDAEQLELPADSFDLVVSRHLLWTLPQPAGAVREWTRVARTGGRVAVIDGEWTARDEAGRPRSDASSTESIYSAPVMAALPHAGGARQADVVAMLEAVGLGSVRTDLLEDVVAAQRERALAEGREPANYVRYVVFGDRPLPG